MDWSGLAHCCSKMPVWPNALLKKLKLAVIGLEGWDSAQHIRLQIYYRNVTVLEVSGVMHWPELAQFGPKMPVLPD